MDNSPAVDNEYLLEKFPGKGGWTYALIADIQQEKRFPFGWMRVRGSIDEYHLESAKLMPMGNGQLFLPVKASIRKVIKKEVGDKVRIVLYEDDAPLGIPPEILECLLDAPQAHKRFLELPEWEQKIYIDSIRDAKKEETKVERIVRMIDKLSG